MNNISQPSEKIVFKDQTALDLKALGVGIVYFFGSRASGNHLEISDYDIGVVFVDFKKIKDNSLDLYLQVYQILNKEIPDMIHGPKLDISFLQKANAILQMKAIKDGQALFEIDPVFRADYEESVFKKYNDYLPIKKEFEEATLKAFSR